MGGYPGKGVVERLHLKYFSIVLFCCHRPHSFVIKKIKDKQKRSPPVEVG